jgi:UPF0755 protein
MLRRIIFLIIGSTILILALLLVSLRFTLSQQLSIPSSGYELTVSDGTGINLVADHLARQKILISPLPVKIYARMFGLNNIKSGDYLLLPELTTIDLLDLVIVGAVRQYSVTFPEGWTLNQWRSRLAMTDNIESTMAGRSNAEIAAYLNIEQANPEGWFAPETYVYSSGDTDLSILRRAHQRMVTKLIELWSHRQKKLPYETAYEALKMASIVEKETGLVEERSHIAGVFVRRLQKGMLLQTDPTVIYGLGEKFDGNLTRRHLRQMTAYNTYLIKGLPPTPIANPGIAAIEAALNPMPGSTLFFVATGDGGHYFSENLAEHNRAVKNFQINGRSKSYRSSRQPTSNKP